MLSVRVDKDVPVETRDGTVLRSDVYRPAEEGRYPVLLGRTCYGKDTWGQWIDPHRTAAEGYAVVINDMRGGFASDGEFDPFFHDGPDGYDLVEWCAERPWSDGKVGMFGSSAPGFAQLLAAAERPPHLVAIAPMQTWTSFGRGCVYDPGGAFLLFSEQWAVLQANIDGARRLAAGEPGYEERRELAAQAAADPGRWYRHLPIDDFPPLPREHTEYFYRWLEHPDHDDFWKPLDVGARYADIEVPALHLVGWFDGFRLGSTHNYVGLRDGAGSELARANQRIVIGPWTHGVPVRAEGGEQPLGAAGRVDVRALVLRWYDHWLRGRSDGLVDEPPVRIYVQGEDRWRDEPDWPPPSAEQVPYYLRGGGRANGRHGDGVLSTEPPEVEPPDSYRHDPDDPVPSVPGQVTRPLAPVDQRPIEERVDVLVYTTPPLAADTEVTGPIVVRLWAATEADDADWVLALVDVAPDGHARRLTEGMLRARYRNGQDAPAPVPPGEAVEYEIELRPTSNLFRAGHRIRLDLSSSSFPLYERNPAAATQLVFHDSERPSHVVLPVIPR